MCCILYHWQEFLEGLTAPCTAFYIASVVWWRPPYSPRLIERVILLCKTFCCFRNDRVPDNCLWFYATYWKYFQRSRKGEIKGNLTSECCLFVDTVIEFIFGFVCAALPHDAMIVQYMLQSCACLSVCLSQGDVNVLRVVCVCAQKIGSV